MSKFFKLAKPELNGHWEADRWIPDERPGVVSKTWLITWWLLILFWLLGTVGFFNQTPAKSAAESAMTALQLVTDISFVIMGLMTVRNRFDRSVIWLFILICVVSLFFNHQSPGSMLNGMRHYTAAPFLLPVFRWLFSKRERAAYFLHKFDKALYVFLWIQWPCMIYEYIVWGGGDHGGGSLGNLFSGAISTLIFAISFYLMLRRWKGNLGYIANIGKNLDLIFLLGPTMLNETKISFIYIVLYFFFLIPMNRKFIKNLIYILPIIALMGAGAIYGYVKFTDAGDTILTSGYVEYYVFGDEDLMRMVEYIYDNGYTDLEDLDFQRGVKLSMLPAVVKDQPHGPWIGYGVSQFKGGKIVERSDFFKKYEWIINGTQLQVMDIIVDLGIVGLLWFIYYSLVLFGVFGLPKKRPKDATNKNLLWMMLCLWLITSFYQANTPNPFLMIVFTFLIIASRYWNRVREYEEIIAQNRLEYEDTDSK